DGVKDLDLLRIEQGLFQIIFCCFLIVLTYAMKGSSTGSLGLGDTDPNRGEEWLRFSGGLSM
ncbi:MAG: hypothetical protein VXX89_05515, partial [Pseudomonadota bacterium]|nr:hypothetical protein [Pseudomonadota bacterium]